MPIQDSTGSRVTLKENRNATLYRHVAAEDDEGVPLDFSVNIPFATFDGVPVTCTVVSDGFYFTVDCSTLRTQVPFEIGWVDTLGRRDVRIYGDLVLV